MRQPKVHLAGNIPNMLSCFRILAAPFLVVISLADKPHWFLTIFGISLFTDFLDGFIARRFNFSTDLGAKLDSIGDIANYLTAPVCAWFLWPEIVTRESTYLIILMSAYLVPLCTGILKFKKIPSYHTYAAKVGAVLVSASVFILFIWDIPWPFRLAVLYQIIVAFEEIGITLYLREHKCNVKSILFLKKTTGKIQ